MIIRLLTAKMNKIFFFFFFFPDFCKVLQLTTVFCYTSEYQAVKLLFVLIWILHFFNLDSNLKTNHFHQNDQKYCIQVLKLQLQKFLYFLNNQKKHASL